HQMVQQYINYYRGRGRRTKEVGLYRSGMFKSMIRRLYREEGIPENIAWLAQVESAWKPTAHSWAAAAGLWQFIPGTGSRYGLRRTAHVDERQSFEQATRASAKYLKFLANRYGGNWELAMAGYNCGEGNVDRAIRRAGAANYWAAYPYLPRETRNYVPNILAVIIIANNPNRYGFGHVRPKRPLNYDRVRVPSSTNLSMLAQATDTDVNYLRYLNPELRTNSTPPEPYVVRIPRGKAKSVVAMFRKIRGAGANVAQLAKSPEGESWENISRRTGVSVSELRKANPGMVKPTGRVIVPLPPGVVATSYSRPVNATRIKIKVVKAVAGDTVAILAKRYNANAGEVAKFNGLRATSKLEAGREIKLPPAK
ncbi:MAG: transglycosylase SLT domain-containing protein, partial [Pyrinomonadaceae bacterium]